MLANFGSRISFCFLFFVILLINCQDFLVAKNINVSYFDELVLGLGFVLYFGFSILNNDLKKVDLKLIILLFVSVIISFTAYYYFVNKFPVNKVLIQTFISFKFFIVFLFFCLMSRFLRHEDFGKVFWLIFIFSVLGFILNYMIPSMFGSREATFLSERGQRIVGFQNKPNDMGIFIGLFSIFLVEKYRCLEKFDKLTFVYFLCFIIIVLTTSRSALIIFMFGAFYGILKARNVLLKSFLVYCFVVGLASFFILVDSFYLNESIRNFSEISNIEHSRYIRFIMLVNSFYLSYDFFPIGTGAGTFGTVSSEGSWVYSYLGLQNLEFFMDFWGIYDSNMAAFIGEYGLIFTVYLFYIAFQFLKRLQVEDGLILMLFLLLVTLNFFQPFISYQVNSFNFLLLLFSIGRLSRGRSKRPVS